jgi:DNA-binding MarR family transcriptional regulator/N-acetylglutamate synthase-like GNAT family acetyltransferase
MNIPNPTNPAFEARVAAVRRFNRAYTRQLGMLQESFLDLPFSLTDMRVLYELAHRDQPSATEIAEALGLDHGYLSRILRGFAVRGLIDRTPTPGDRRQNRLELTAKGRAEFAICEKRSRQAVAATLARLPDAAQDHLVAAMGTIETMTDTTPAPFTLRPHRPGDIGWVVARHGALYAQEYGWSISFEALVAEIAAGFLRDFDATREACWIAEINGAPLGSVFLVRASDDVAKLRLLLVEPSARGHGVGRALVEQCIDFARERGYRKITLWTQSILVGARAIYQRAGFTHVGTEPHRSFGVELVGETWELTL